MTDHRCVLKINKLASFSQNRLYKAQQNAILLMPCLIAQIISILVYFLFVNVDARITADGNFFRTGNVKAKDEYFQKNVLQYSDDSKDADEESPEEKLIRQCDKSDVTGTIPECNTEVSLS